MLIGLLAVLGVDLIVIVVLLGAVLSRRGWVSHQPGAFKGAIRVTQGEVPGLKPKWRRGYGRWVGEVLVSTKAPFLFWNEFLLAPDVPAGHQGRGGPAGGCDLAQGKYCYQQHLSITNQLPGPTAAAALPRGRGWHAQGGMSS